VSERVTYARELVAAGHRPAVVARILTISRQAISRVPRPRRAPASPAKGSVDEVEAAIVDVAIEHPTDGYRMVTAWVRRRLGRRVNRKRVLRVMRERRLIQRRRPLERRRRPGFFRVERPDQPWHLDMTSVWVAEHGWVYLMAAIDCCTARSSPGSWRPAAAPARRSRAALERGIPPGTLTLGTDNGSAFTARACKAVLAALGIAHRRGGYRDPESQAFIESWFGKLKQRCVWRHEFETLDEAREVIGAYVTPLPPPTAVTAGLPDAARSRGDLKRWRTTPPNPSGLNCQRGRGARHRWPRCGPIGTMKRER
jgi:putative transposase